MTKDKRQKEKDIRQKTKGKRQKIKGKKKKKTSYNLTFNLLQQTVTLTYRRNGWQR
jgi:hypothetical protein